MKLLILSVVSFCFVEMKAQKINKKLLPTKDIVCNYVMDLTVRTIEHFFRDQHSLTLIDFSEVSTLSSFTCTHGNDFIPVYDYDKWSKVNLGRRISNGGLSAFSTTRGFMFKCSHNEEVSLIALIANFNPMAKLLIVLEQESFAKARELLEIGWAHKMLDVAVMMQFTVFDGTHNVGTNISLCLLNPFAGNKKERRPEFKCFNITKKDVPFDKIDAFLESRISNLQQYPLRIDIFEEVLLSRAVRNGNGMVTHYEYADGDTIEQLASIMNFTPIYIKPNDSLKHGYQLPNGSFTGSLAAIENESADFAAIPAFIAEYNTKKLLFLQPIAMKKLTFIFQKRETFKVFIVSIISQLDFTSKVLTAFLALAFPIIYFLISKIESKVKGVERTSTTQHIVYVVAMMTSNSSIVSKLWASRIVVAAVLFYTLLFSSLFQGSIIKSLNQNQKGGGITSVSELLMENYTLIMERSLVPVFQEQGGNELGVQLQSLANNFSRIVDTTTRGFELALANKKIAFLLSDSSLPMLSQFYNDATGEDLFDVLPKSVFEFFVSPMSPKDSPFVVNFSFKNSCSKLILF